MYMHTVRKFILSSTKVVYEFLHYKKLDWFLKFYSIYMCPLV